MTGPVVVTGVSRFLGAHVAARLAADSRVDRVVGVDPASPRGELGRLLADVPVVRADLAESADAVVAQRPSVVVHLGISTSPEVSGDRAAMKEQNVIGTMQLLAACQRTPGLRKLVLRSSTAAYGASFFDPAVFTEDMEPQEVPRGGFARDILDIESYVRRFQAKCPGVTATVLRFAPLLGAAADTSLTRYFGQSVVPTVFGRDPRLQFLHVDDAFETLHRAVLADHAGTFNVAGPGVLTLSQAIRRAGRVPLPVIEPGLSTAAAFSKRLGRAGLGLDQIDLFVHGRVVDIGRLVAAFGFTPRSTSAAFADFLAGQRTGPLDSDRLAAAERWVLAGVERLAARWQR